MRSEATATLAEAVAQNAATEHARASAKYASACAARCAGYADELRKYAEMHPEDARVNADSRRAFDATKKAEWQAEMAAAHATDSGTAKSLFSAQRHRAEAAGCACQAEAWAGGIELELQTCEHRWPSHKEVPA